MRQEYPPPTPWNPLGPGARRQYAEPLNRASEAARPAPSNFKSQATHIYVPSRWQWLSPSHKTVITLHVTVPSALRVPPTLMLFVARPMKAITSWLMISWPLTCVGMLTVLSLKGRIDKVPDCCAVHVAPGLHTDSGVRERADSRLLQLRRSGRAS